MQRKGGDNPLWPQLPPPSLWFHRLQDRGHRDISPSSSPGPSCRTAHSPGVTDPFASAGCSAAIQALSFQGDIDKQI